jgi:hypothetical protein
LPASSLEDTVRAHCDALLMGDLMRVMNDLTPEALGALMASGANVAMMPVLIGYEVVGQEAVGDDQVVRLAFTTPDRVIIATETWRVIDDIWKITKIDVEGL